MKKLTHQAPAGITISGFCQQWCPPSAAERRHTGDAKLGRSQAGFTIIELLIATMVFSTILLVITYGVLSFTHAYYKGINSSTTQDAALNISETITQAIQLSGDGSSVVPTPDPTPPAGAIDSFCVGNQIYIFKPGVQYTGTTSLSTPGLFVATQTGSCSPTGVVISPTTGKQLLSAHMRVAELTVGLATGTPLDNPQLYNVHLRLVYSSGGDPSNDGADLLTVPSGAGDTVKCKAQIGSQFCAVSVLTTSVNKRVLN